MKFIMKYTLSILILFSFTACQLFEDSPELQEKKQELELKKLQISQEKELAEIEMQKSLAEMEKEKVLQLQKLQNDIKEKEMSFSSEKELELIKQKIALQEGSHGLAYQKYMFMFLALVILIISFFLFYFFKKKREDKLRAYNDNLKKYFYMKENESRMRIAEKILNTIAEGELSRENEQKLIDAFSGERREFDSEAEIIEMIGTGSSVSEHDMDTQEEKKEKNEVD